MTICNDMSYIYESDRRKTYRIPEPSLRRLSRRNRRSKPRVEPQNRLKRKRGFTWVHLIEFAQRLRLRFLRGTLFNRYRFHETQPASTVLALSLPNQPFPPWIRPTFSEARPAIDPSSILYIYISNISEVWHCKPV